MIVHIFGLPVDMDPIITLANKYGIKIIEDSAEMHGQNYKGKPCGSFGDVSTFSFYPNKHITTGEGGMILTDDDELADTCRSLRNLCFQPDKRFVHERLGWNLRMTSMQAAVGVAQLERLDEFVCKKRKMGKQYLEQLSDIDSLQLPQESTSYAENIYWVFGVIIKESVGLDASSAMKKLAARGIGTRPFFYPMHQQPALLKRGLFANESYPRAEKMYKQGFYLPSGIGITQQKIENVVKEVRNIFR